MRKDRSIRFEKFYLNADSRESNADSRGLLSVNPRPFACNPRKSAFKDERSLKIDLTDFEWKVLKATAKIPLGQTRSYQWIAEKIGRPKAVRAVGQALHKNPFPLIIPCHRVIQKNGACGGFACGPKRKERLLHLEKEILKNFRNVSAKTQGR